MIYDDFAQTVTANYKLFLTALFGRYQSIIAAGVTVTPHAVREFATDATDLSLTFFSTVRDKIEHYQKELYLESGDSPQTAETAKDEALASLNKAVLANIGQLVKLLRVGTADYKKAGGAMGQLIQKKLGSVEFKVYDTANRKWDAVRIVTVTMRDFAYQTWVDQRLKQLQDEGYTLAQVKYDDPAKVGREIVFAIEKKVGDYPNLDDIRASVFHINSTAKVVGYVLS